MERTEGSRLNDQLLAERNVAPACAQACPTNALMFGDQLDESSQIRPYFDDVNAHDIHHEDERTTRSYLLLEELNVKPNVIYLKKVEPYPVGESEHHG